MDLKRSQPQQIQPSNEAQRAHEIKARFTLIPTLKLLLSFGHLLQARELGKVFSIKDLKGNTAFTFISDANLIKEFIAISNAEVAAASQLRKEGDIEGYNNFEYSTDQGSTASELERIGPGLISEPLGPRWNSMRADTAAAISNPDPHFEISQSVEKMIGQIQRELDEKGEVDLSYFLQTYTLQVILAQVLGVDIEQIDSSTYLKRVTKALMAYVAPSQLGIDTENLSEQSLIQRALKSPIAAIQRFTRDNLYDSLDEMMAASLQVEQAELSTVVNELIQTGEDYAQEEGKPNYLSTLAGHGFGLSEMRGLINQLIAAGSETTASVLGFILKHVYEDPQLLASLQAEIAERNIDLSDRAQVRKYMQDRNSLLAGVIYEALRLYPPAYLVPAGIKKDITLGEYSFSEGDQIQFVLLHMQRDPVAFTEPDEFDPSRWQPGSPRHTDHKLMMDHYEPFWAGARACIGRNMATQELFMGAIAFMQNLPDLKVVRSSASPDIRQGVTKPGPVVVARK